MPSGFMKRTMSYLGMSDVVDDDDEFEEDEEVESASSFDSDRSVTPMPTAQAATSTASQSRSKSVNAFQDRVSRITTIQPRTYEEAQKVGRALRDGIPVVLNLTGVPEAVAYRIVDFSSGVVFGISGSIERVTPRVFLLSPARVDIVAEEDGPARDLFAE